MHNASAPRGIARRLLPAIGTACLSTLICIGQAAAAPPNDSQILGIYIQVNSFDVETALLGKSQANSDEVRALAQHVASDHAGVRQGAFALAEKCKVTPELPADRSAAASEHANVLVTLMALKGAEFDKAYLKHEVAFHRAAIAAVKTALLPSAQCADLQAHFRDVLPAFEHHLKMTEDLAAKLGVM